LPLRLILLAALLCLVCSSMLAQSNNTSYTSDMPSVERVKAEIKGSDPTDTLARQVAVFTYLSAYIQRIKYNRSYSGPFTPDEQRLMGAYDLAAYQISQDYAKSHTADEAKAFERLHGQYEMNSDFYKDWSKRLIGKQSAAAYKGAETGLAATAKAHFDEEKRVNDEARANASKASGGLSNDATAVATRRCLELGGTPSGCMGKGFMSGFMDLVGVNTEEIVGPGRAGVILFGAYKNPGTTMSLGFGAETVTLGGCGKLVPGGHAYTLEKRPGSLRVTVENEPHPIVLTMRLDGGLTGPGLIDVKGSIITGYHNVTETLYMNGQPVVDASCGGVCSKTTSVADYAPKIERCTIGSLAAPPPPKPAPANAQPAGDSGILGMLTGFVDSIGVGGGGEPGLRMTGKYGGGMLLLDFSAGTVTLDCGQAHVRQPYTVENTPNQLLIHVENSGGPFTLAVEPNNTLRGSGSTSVNGRLVTGMNGDNVAFAPHSERCDVAALSPKTGSAPTTHTSSSTAVAVNTPSALPAAEPAVRPSATVEAASSERPAVAPASAPSTEVRASMRVAIAADFPSGSNPMVGQSVMVMRERMDEVLRKLGVAIPTNATPGQAMQTLATTCKATNCRAVIDGMGHYFVTTVKLDAAGKATLSAQAATGPYSFFAFVRTPNGSMVWDIPANLRAGDNAITLTATNAELVP
jgi:hypothetical protein